MHSVIVAVAPALLASLAAPAAAKVVAVAAVVVGIGGSIRTVCVSVSVCLRIGSSGYLHNSSSHSVRDSCIINHNASIHAMPTLCLPVAVDVAVSVSAPLWLVDPMA